MMEATPCGQKQWHLNWDRGSIIGQRSDDGVGMYSIVVSNVSFINGGNHVKNSHKVCTKSFFVMTSSVKKCFLICRKIITLSNKLIFSRLLQWLQCSSW